MSVDNYMNAPAEKILPYQHVGAPPEAQRGTLNLTGNLPESILREISYQSIPYHLSPVCKVFAQICNHETLPLQIIATVGNYLQLDKETPFTLNRLVKRLSGVTLKNISIGQHPSRVSSLYSDPKNPSLELFFKKQKQYETAKQQMFDECLKQLDVNPSKSFSFEALKHLSNLELRNLATGSLICEKKHTLTPSLPKLFQLIHAAKPELFTEEDFEDLLDQAVEFGDLSTIRLLQANCFLPNYTVSNYSMMMIHAVGNGQVEVLRNLVQQGVDPAMTNIAGVTLMHNAAACNRSAVIRFLHGLTSNANTVNEEQVTPLHLAASSGHVRAMQTLIELGGDVEAKDKEGNTPLHNAAIRNKADAVYLLIALNAELESRNNMGRTPLYLAAMSNSFYTVSVLQELGADIQAPDNQGLTVSQQSHIYYRN